MRRPGDTALALLTVLLAFVALAATTATSDGVAWNYLVSVLIVMEIYALFSLGISLEFGYTGLLNFGHVAFMGVGGYAAAIVVQRLEGVDRALSSRLEGWSLAGAVAVLFLCAVLSLLASAPLNAAAHRWLPAAWRGRRKTRTAIAGGAAVGVAVFAASYPLSQQGAADAVAWLAVLAGIALAGFLGILLGLPAIRLREDYLAIVALGGSEIIRSVFMNEDWLTNGTLGLRNFTRPVVDWAVATGWWGTLADALDVRPVALAHAGLGLVVVLYVLFIFEALARSPWGRVLKAIREDEDVATTLGKDVRWFKLQSLMIGSAVAAAAGVLLVWQLSSVYPEHFPTIATFFAFIIVVVGGMGNHKGAIAGTAILWALFEVARGLTVRAQAGSANLAGPPQQIFIGLLLILVMLFRPQGLLGRKEELVHAR